MEGQTRLTDAWLKPVVPSHLIAPSPSCSHSPSASSSAISRAALRVSSKVSSRAHSIAESSGPSPSPSPSEVPNDSPPFSQNPLRIPSPSILQKRTPVELEVSDLESEVESHHYGAAASTGDPANDDNGGGNPANDSESEEEAMDDFLDAGGAEPKQNNNVQGWHELREQIKSDLEMAHKQKAPITKTNQYTILCNFTTLHIKGRGRMAVSAYGGTMGCEVGLEEYKAEKGCVHGWA